MERTSDKRPPFPQANDLGKVFQIVNVPDEETILSDDELGAYLDGITSRQARYYIAAAKYLGILDESKHLTERGRSLRGMNTYAQRVELIRIVLSDYVFGTVFISEKVLGFSLEKEDVAEIIEQCYPDYCEAIYTRRAQTVVSWVRWINEQFQGE